MPRPPKSVFKVITVKRNEVGVSVREVRRQQKISVELKWNSVQTVEGGEFLR